MKIRRFRSEDGLESAWGLSWARFGCSRGLLGSPFGGLGGFLGAPGGYQASFKVILELSFWLLFGVFVVVLLDSSASHRFEVVMDLLLGPLFSHLRASGGGF